MDVSTFGRKPKVNKLGKKPVSHCKRFPFFFFLICWYLHFNRTKDSKGETVWRVSWSITGSILAVSSGENKVTLWKESLDPEPQVIMISNDMISSAQQFLQGSERGKWVCVSRTGGE